MTKVIFLDRDGIINQDSEHYVKSPAEFNLLPGSAEAIVKLTREGYRIGIATNQSGVAQGFYSEQDLLAIHEKMTNLISEAGGVINAIEYCIHLPQANCACRKPSPGMLKRLAERFACELNDKICFVGDRITDVKAAQAVGLKPILILSPMTEVHLLPDYKHIPQYPSLAHFVADWLSN